MLDQLFLECGYTKVEGNGILKKKLRMNSQADKISNLTTHEHLSSISPTHGDPYR